LDKIETIIGSHTSFDGHLKCDGNIRIEGVCEGGVIETVGNVVVTPQARVAAKIIAQHVSVAGEVSGGIYARGRLEILSTGRVSGDVRVKNFYKDEAGVLSGKLWMGDIEQAPEPEPETAETEEK
jgi:cytoskeletal protein CcmA (bactofilin family)